MTQTLVQTYCSACLQPVACDISETQQNRVVVLQSSHDKEQQSLDKATVLESSFDLEKLSRFITTPDVYTQQSTVNVENAAWRLNIGTDATAIALSMVQLLELQSTDLVSTEFHHQLATGDSAFGLAWNGSMATTSCWRGVKLVDALVALGVVGQDNLSQYRHAVFKGTSASGCPLEVSLETQLVLDPGRSILLAYMKSNALLCSGSIYFVFPGMVSPSICSAESITFTNDLPQTPSSFPLRPMGLSSVVVMPQHDDLLVIGKNQAVTFKGYAATGSGSKISRVELSLNGGQTWLAASTQHVDLPPSQLSTAGLPSTKTDCHWCWCLWEAQVTIIELLAATDREIAVRAWDSHGNTQPAVASSGPYPSITAAIAGDNGHWRVKLHPQQDESGQLALRVQYPLVPRPGPLGNMGWRQPAAPPPTSTTTTTTAATAQPPARLIPMSEVARHNNAESAWFVCEGKVYDATPFLEAHPGGAESILLVAGTDATGEFNSIHSQKAKEMLRDYYIGMLGPETEPAAAVTDDSAAVAEEVVDPNEPAFNPRKKVQVTLVEKEHLSHNVRRFRFALPHPEQRAGLPVGKHMFIYADVAGETVMRAYTPTSDDEQAGSFDLVVKVYRGEQFNGKMSQHLDSLELGAHLTVKGPVGHFVYEGMGRYLLSGRKHCQASHMNFIAGGTGITPCYQVIKAVLRDPNDPTLLCLIYVNQTVGDILLRKELDALAAAHPSRLRIWYSLTRESPPAGWLWGTGRVDESVMRQVMYPAHGPDSVVLMCGPPAMIQDVCVPAARTLGFDNDQVVVF